MLPKLDIFHDMQTQLIRSHAQDLTGQIFGYWTVLHFHSRIKDCQYRWFCQCKCGEKKPVLKQSLLNGSSLSCGCHRKEWLAQLHESSPRNSETHKQAYSTWLAMKTRCYNLGHPSSKEYGHRGIKVCDRWVNSFANFLADMGDPLFPGLSIERRDTNGDYAPENCSWADRSTQNTNRRTTQFYEWDGEVLTLTSIARSEDVRYNSFRNYVVMGLTVQEAIGICRKNKLTYIPRSKMELQALLDSL